MRRNAHELVAATARGMAEDLYERYASDNRFYAATHKQQGREAFIARLSIDLLEDARATLASMLGRDDVPETTKQFIHEALILDDDLRHGRLKAWHPTHRMN